MSTLLRPSSRQVARLALSSLRTTSRTGGARAGVRIPRIAPTSSSSAYLLPRPRYYSTNPTPPPEKPKNEAKEGDKKQAEDPTKSDDGVVKASDQDAAKPESKEPPKLPEGWVRLTDEELGTLIGMQELVPGRQRDAMIEIVSRIKTSGAPLELRDLLRKQKSQGLSISDAMQAIRIAHKLASTFATQDSQQQMFNSNEPRLGGEEGAKKPDEEASGQAGEQKGKQDGGKKNQKGRKDPNIKVLDAGDLMGYILAAALFYPIWSTIFPNESRDISWQELRRNYLDKGLVEQLVVMGRSRVRVVLNQEATRSMYPDSVAANPGFNFYVSIGSIDTFERHLDQAQDELQIPTAERIPVIYEGESQLGQIINAFGPVLLVMGLIYYTMRRGPGGGGGAGGGMFGFGKSKAKMYNHETAVQVKFADIAGMDEAKVEIMEFVAFLKQPERFQRLGAKIPRGAILSGPPGTGKTLLAKATAGESGVPFFSVSGSEFVEMFVGVGASRVRDLFAQARKNSPCIVFIDEIDAIGRSRSEGKQFGGNEEREATLNQILTEMDGFNTAEQIVVLAGTNRPDVLDQALMRPGRFDRQIHIDRPTMKGRADIFKVHLGKIVTKEEMEHLSGRLAALTPGFSGADIANAVNEAALVGMFILGKLHDATRI